MENVIIKKGVFPAWAGVILTVSPFVLFFFGVPRVGGGDPEQKSRRHKEVWCSPRGRG